jgi:putative hydrolase of the HAD superfamily
MPRALLSDLFSTLVPAGDSQRHAMSVAMSKALGVDPEAFVREFDAPSYERFIGAYGDLPSTLRVIAGRCGVTPTDEQVQEATNLRRTSSRKPLRAAPPATLNTLGAFKAAATATTTNSERQPPSACMSSKPPNTPPATRPGPAR